MSILIDGRSAGLDRISGWERYTRDLIRAVSGRPNVRSIFSHKSSGLAGRIYRDWVSLPVAARDATFTHFPSYPPSRFISLSRSVSTIHDLTWWRHPETSSPLGRRYYKPLAARAVHSARLITVSQAVADEMIDRWPTAAVRVISPVVALHTLEQSRLPDQLAVYNDRPFLLVLGSVEPRKNLVRLARAWERARRYDMDLVAVGRQAWGELPRGLAFTGPVTDSVLRALMARASGLVAASIYEGFGLPVAEALACGVPVYCSRIPAFVEVAGDRATYFDPEDDDNLVAVLEAAHVVNGLNTPTGTLYTHAYVRKQFENVYWELEQ